MILAAVCNTDLAVLSKLHSNVVGSAFCEGNSLEIELGSMAHVL